MNTTNSPAAAERPGRDLSPLLRPVMLVRIGLAGVLSGLANLVPGISGGTMILVTGLYNAMVSSVAEITRLQFTRRNLFLVLAVGGTAGVCIVSLAGPVYYLVTTHRSAMRSLFIGLTFGGVPLLYSLIRPLRAGPWVALAAGLVLSAALALLAVDSPDEEALKAGIARSEFLIESNYGLDLFGGILAVSAMVLPGISGSYMLLLIDRYETVLISIYSAKSYCLSFGSEGGLSGMGVLVPMAIGAVVGLVAVSNLLKWLLHAHEKLTLAVLLGILLGSVYGLWPFSSDSDPMEYTWGTALAAGGFAVTFCLSRLGGDAKI